MTPTSINLVGQQLGHARWSAPSGPAHAGETGKRRRLSSTVRVGARHALDAGARPGASDPHHRVGALVARGAPLDVELAPLRRPGPAVLAFYGRTSAVTSDNPAASTATAA